MSAKKQLRHQYEEQFRLAQHKRFGASSEKTLQVRRRFRCCVSPTNRHNPIRICGCTGRMGPAIVLYGLPTRLVGQKLVRSSTVWLRQRKKTA